MKDQATHLFISYATEQAGLASWLARKLAAAGYAVWFDQLKLLGGEPWPQSIDDAIKNRTFRMLALISSDSLKKPKPTGERTLAQRIASERGIQDFMIPLRVDESEFDWMTTALTYVPFNEGWAAGWRALNKKLDQIKAPRSLGQGSFLAASTFPRGEELLVHSPEVIRANVLRIQEVPGKIYVHRPARSLRSNEFERLDDSWTHERLTPDTFVSFSLPPNECAGLFRSSVADFRWQDREEFKNVRTRDIFVRLIHKSLARRLRRIGCVPHPNEKWKGTFYLSSSFTNNGKLSFTGPNGRRTWLLIRGIVTFRTRDGKRETNHHHFGFRLRIARGLDQSHYIQVTPTLVFFDARSDPILDASVGSRRRRMTKMWYNHKWLSRLLATVEVLSQIEAEPGGVVLLEPGLLTLSSPIGINENLLSPEREDEILKDVDLDLEEAC